MFEREDDGSFVPVLFRLANVLRAKDYRTATA
jgi:phosphohistidine phosphatase